MTARTRESSDVQNGANVSVRGDYEPSPHESVRDQVELYEATGGAEGSTLNGDPALPVVILTSRGVRSGRTRKTPLMRIEHAGTYAVVAATGGAPTNPGWYHNVRADPLVELRDRDVVHRLRAREVSGEEKERWIAFVDALYAWYPDFRAQAAEAGRDIPLLVLEPATA